MSCRIISIDVIFTNRSLQIYLSIYFFKFDVKKKWLMIFVDFDYLPEFYLFYFIFVATVNLF